MGTDQPLCGTVARQDGAGAGNWSGLLAWPTCAKCRAAAEAQGPHPETGRRRPAGDADADGGGEVTAVSVSTTMTVIECAACAIAFAVPARFEQERRRDHRQFFCPHGHSNYFAAQSAEERLAKQVADLKATVTHARDEAEWERERRQATERSLAATRGVLTRTRRRVAAGVCPCCHRTFQQLARHMAGQHPEYTAEEAQG
jgi:hypothetical protein